MRILQFPAYLLFVLLLPIISCVKIAPGFDPRDGNNVYSGCKILKTVSKESAADPYVYTRTFFYNPKGDPEKILTDRQITGKQNIGFKYDKYGRLQEYSAGYTNGGFDFIHRYKYENNRVVVDSVFTSISTFLPPVVTLYYPKYDNLNRVIEDSIVLNSKAYFLQKYIYDVKGNLANWDYDEKINPHRTNRVWMFIDRNYSVNNPVGASSYNQSGLPLVFPPSDEDNFQLTAFAYGNGGVTISYDCR
jgi:hypothetical protein